jgi:hypothetical protein
MHTLIKPYHLLLIITTVFLISSFFVNRNNVLDIHLHDTYFIFLQKHIFWCFAMFSFLLWVTYFTFSSFLYSPTLSWLHIILTTVILIVLFVTIFYDGRKFYIVNKLFVNLSITLILLQVLLLVNFALAFLKSSKLA